VRRICNFFNENAILQTFLHDFCVPRETFAQGQSKERNDFMEWEVKKDAPALCQGEVVYLSPYQIRPNPSQPRNEFDEEALVQLADSIKEYGILQPLSVRPLPNTDLDGKSYELVAGERRLRAAKLVGCERVPCILVHIDGKKSAELAIIENIQRKDLNMFEEASAIASLIDLYALTQDQVAKRLSTSQSYVANKLRILRLTPFEREKILRHHLAERHARALLRIESPDLRAQVLSDIISRSMNVAEAEEYIEKQLNSPKNSKKSAEKVQRKLILKDIRLFYNTIDKAISTVRNAGVNIISSKSESEEAIELTIVIPKQHSNVEKSQVTPQEKEIPSVAPKESDEEDVANIIFSRTEVGFPLTQSNSTLHTQPARDSASQDAELEALLRTLTPT
jgi:ParB family chromosome partitioning protein